MITRLAKLPLLLLLLQLLAVLHCVSAASSGRAGRSKRAWGLDWSDWSLWPDDEGDEILQDDDDPSYFVNGVIFQLYTRKNADEPVFINISDTSGVPPKYFNAKKPVKIITHGWQTDGIGVNQLKDAFLRVMDVNCILVNWTSIDTIFYPRARQNVPHIGQRVSLLIDYLRVVHHVSLASMHLIGHSLGAHISGLAGRNAQSGTVARITGLDPAGVFIPTNPNERLDKSDAHFVDVIHTCANVLGISSCVGHVDFFPNGGTCSQPGCTILDLTHGTCSHNRAFDYMEESIRNRGSFVAFPCKGEYGSPDLDGESIVMGLDVPLNATGTYCLKTSNSSPFAMTPEEMAEDSWRFWPFTQLQLAVQTPGIQAEEDRNDLRGSLSGHAKDAAQSRLEYTILRRFMRRGARQPKLRKH